jgi:hypothetical protein
MVGIEVHDPKGTSVTPIAPWFKNSLLESRNLTRTKYFEVAVFNRHDFKAKLGVVGHG